MVDHQRDLDGWRLSESGPEDAEHTVLLLPGGMCTAAFYDDLVAEPVLLAASLRLVATTLPGHGGTPEPADLAVESCAREAGRLARDIGCDVVVGHSMGANVAIEMACAGEFIGPMVLLSPSFSRADESRFLRVLDHAGRALGPLPFRAMLAMVGASLKEVKVTPERRAALATELRKNDPRFVRRAVRSYFEYLDRQASLARRLCESGGATWVVFGDHGDVGLQDDERAALDDCHNVAVQVVPDAGHLTLNEQPGRVARIVLDAVSSLAT
jgi:pimeloyl-ACP methyl ester carboxylesterase